MPVSILQATVQSAIICVLSCIVAQLLKPENPPHYLSLITYSLLATPPNFLWQKKLEQWFPGFRLQKVEVDDGGKGVEVEKKLNVKNTVIKVLLEQTVAAVPNVAGYIGVTRWLRGVPLDLCVSAVREQFLPVMVAGYKLWPAVSFVQQVFVPVERRTLVASLVGLGWGTFLALTAAR